jgi:glycosyltransferase involved in cell wall biosynthesis
VRSWLLVSGDFTPFGGMDAANYALARYLAAREDVHLVTHQAWPDLASMPTVTVHRVWRPLDWHFLGSALLSRAGRDIWRRLAPLGVRTIVNGGNCRVGAANWVHYLHAAYVPNHAGSLIRRSKALLIRNRDLAAERSALREAPVVICNSHRTRVDVIDRVGVDPARVRVVYYGSDPLRFSAVDPCERENARRALGLSLDRPLVGFVGALGDRRKAFDVLFQAWTELCRRPGWDADLVVVGTGAELPDWQRRAKEAGLQDRIRFAGFRHDMPAVLGALDALVHPARYEAYGLSVHEALCRGVPAFVSAKAGVAERYPAELADLLIVNPDDAGELGERLIAWRDNTERFRSLLAPLSSKLRSRSWDAMAADIAELVDRAEAA